MYHNKKGWPYFMSKRKKKSIDLGQFLPDQQMKFEIAEELGLLDKVKEKGWKGLTAQETGRIGGLMTQRKREMKKGAEKVAETEGRT